MNYQISSEVFYIHCKETKTLTILTSEEVDNALISIEIKGQLSSIFINLFEKEVSLKKTCKEFNCKEEVIRYYLQTLQDLKVLNGPKASSYLKVGNIKEELIASFEGLGDITRIIIDFDDDTERISQRNTVTC